MTEEQVQFKDKLYYSSAELALNATQRQIQSAEMVLKDISDPIDESRIKNHMQIVRNAYLKLRNAIIISRRTKSVNQHSKLLDKVGGLTSNYMDDLADLARTYDRAVHHYSAKDRD